MWQLILFFPDLGLGAGTRHDGMTPLVCFSLLL